MADAQVKTVHYKRSHFATQLPTDYVYSPSHCWLAREAQNQWRVGLTKFATRMLGEMVDHGFDVEPGAKVQIGQILGWVEGFKAISDLFCVAQGKFLETNGVLKERIQLVTKDCYKAGWLYRVEGEIDSRCMDVHTYIGLLDKTIDKILEKQKGDEIQ
jgi:glycine cleavage system H protein